MPVISVLFGSGADRGGLSEASWNGLDSSLINGQNKSKLQLIALQDRKDLREGQPQKIVI